MKKSRSLSEKWSFGTKKRRCSDSTLVLPITSSISRGGSEHVLYINRCEQLRLALLNVPSAPTIEAYLLQVGWAYWSFALANRSYYSVMFCGAIPYFTP